MRQQEVPRSGGYRPEYAFDGGGGYRPGIEADAAHLLKVYDRDNGEPARVARIDAAATMDQ